MNNVDWLVGWFERLIPGTTPQLDPMIISSVMLQFYVEVPVDVGLPIQIYPETTTKKGAKADCST